MMKNFFQNTCKPQGTAGKMIVAMMNKGHARLAEWGFSHLPAREGIDVLDIGCGGGANLAVHLSRSQTGLVTGVDYSEVSVQKSSQVNSAAISGGRCRVIQGNVRDLPFDPGVFDLITAFETIYFWPEPEACFAGICRVLRPGGTFLICNEDSDPSNDRWTKIIEGMTIYSGDQLEQWLKKAGFVNITLDRSPKHPWLCVTAQKGS